MSSDSLFMQEALKEAKQAFDKGEVPVGAIVVIDGEIIARAHNLVETFRDATAHAEVLALRAAAAQLGNWRLNEATLYCTLEPCAMCAGAMILSRVGTLVWGAKDMRHGAHGSWVNLLDAEHPIHTLTVRSGVCESESAELMRTFFQMRRRHGTDIRRDDRAAEEKAPGLCANDRAACHCR